jgi:hypothetical protein
VEASECATEYGTTTKFFSHCRYPHIPTSESFGALMPGIVCHIVGMRYLPGHPVVLICSASRVSEYTSLVPYQFHCSPCLYHLAPSCLAGHLPACAQLISIKIPFNHYCYPCLLLHVDSRKPFAWSIYYWCERFDNGGYMLHGSEATRDRRPCHA